MDVVYFGSREIYGDFYTAIRSFYNACKFTHPVLDPAIIHYADRRDWRDLPEVMRYK